MMTEKSIDRLLLFLIALDVVIFIAGFFFPELWCQVFHGQTFPDGLGLLRRTASLWLAFAVFQTIALMHWRKNHLWLAVVAGMRLSEMFSDWVYAFNAEQLTWFGWIALLSSPPSNIWFGYILLKKSNELFNARIKNENVVI